MLEPLLVPRVEQYGHNNDYRDVEAVSEYMRRNYREYQRKQQGPFRKMVMKAIQLVDRKNANSQSLERKLRLREEKHLEKRGIIRKSSKSEEDDDSGEEEVEEEEEEEEEDEGEEGEEEDKVIEGEEDGTGPPKKKQKRSIATSDSEDEDDIGNISIKGLVDDDMLVTKKGEGLNLLNSSLRMTYDKRPHLLLEPKSSEKTPSKSLLENVESMKTPSASKLFSSVQKRKAARISGRLEEVSIKENSFEASLRRVGEEEDARGEIGGISISKKALLSNVVNRESPIMVVDSTPKPERCRNSGNVDGNNVGETFRNGEENSVIPSLVKAGIVPETLIRFEKENLGEERGEKAPEWNAAVTGRSSGLKVGEGSKSVRKSLSDKEGRLRGSLTPKAQRREREGMEKSKGGGEERRERASAQSVPRQVRFSDFGGIENILKEIWEVIECPLAHPEVYEWLGLDPPRGVLLHGPPGCGKTMLAHAIAVETGVPFLKISAPEVVSGMSGESEAKVRSLFADAQRLAPCIVFIDEIDAITPKRETAQREMERRIVAQLLTCMDDLNEGVGPIQREGGETEIEDESRSQRGHVVIIGATNRPDSLDPALRRAGRFDREIALGIPDENARARILEVMAKRLRLEGSFDFKQVARNTPGFVGADLQALTKEAAAIAVKRILSKFEPSSTVGFFPSPNPVGSFSEEKSRISLDKVEEDMGSVKRGNGGGESGERENGEGKGLEEAGILRDCGGQEVVQNLTSEGIERETKGGEKDLERERTKEEVVQQGPENHGEIVENGILRGCERKGEREREVENGKGNELICGKSKELIEVPLEINRERWKRKWTKEELEPLKITMADFEAAVGKVQPSSKREGFATIPDVTWEDVGALGDVREELEFSISRPIKQPEEYEAMGLDMAVGVLLYGPPGCGKTLVAKAIAAEAGANFISIKGPELLNKYVGESERAVRQLFSRARASAPCVLFFDEMDAMAPRRGSDGNQAAERVVNQLLTEMDGLESRKSIYLIAATNRPDMIDSALLRPGRLDKLLYVPLPDARGRESIALSLSRKVPVAPDADVAELARSDSCRGFSGADLASLMREACIAALRERIVGNPKKKKGTNCNQRKKK